MLREKDVAHVHVAAGIYYLSWYENEWGKLIGPGISPLEFANVEWDDMNMWRSYDNETDKLSELAKALPTFEGNYWSYACGVIEDVVADNV